MKNLTQIVSIIQSAQRMESLFFEAEKEQHIDLTVYQDQVLARPLNNFWCDCSLDVTKPLVMEDSALVHKGVATNCWEEVRNKYHATPT